MNSLEVNYMQSWSIMSIKEVKIGIFFKKLTSFPRESFVKYLNKHQALQLSRRPEQK